LKKALPKFTPQSKKSDVNRPSSFVFCERSGVAAHFRAEATADLDCTVERMAGLLAMQCLVRGTDPGDFEILVAAERGLRADCSPARKNSSKRAALSRAPA
jgi:hypothetical protein